jgi:nucleoid-associated protein YgaU
MSSSRSGAKLFVAFIVLGGAFLLANAFRRERARNVFPVRHANEHVVLRETPAPGDIDSVYPDAPTAEIQPTLIAPPPDASDHRYVAKEPPRLAPPPNMARSYPGSSTFQGNATGLFEPNRQRTIRRTHEVQDGDTLESLAQRYLGDRSRWREIFDVNREQIPQPELLPLATKLVIPSKLPGPSYQSSVETPDNQVVTQAPLVPLVP